MTKLLLLQLILVCVGLNGLTLAQDEDEGDCLLSRLDVLPCKARSSNKMPSDNQFGLYRTKIQVGSSGGLECRYRNPRREDNELIADITALEENFLILFSPGFLLDDPYANQLVVLFNVKCPAERMAFFNVTSLQLREECQGQCVDYVSVDRGQFGVTENCGSTVDPNEGMFQLEQGEFTVTFRTSKENSEKGFQIYIICFNPEERDLPGCVNFDNGEGSTVTRNRKKRDLEEFHNMWQSRLKRQAQNVRFMEITVEFGANVTYSNNVITVISRNGPVSARIRNVLVLETFDVEGVLEAYIGKLVDENGAPFLLRGPGPMVIIDRYAYFQLFAIDPRGLVPNEVEEQALGNMTTSLLEQLDPLEDIRIAMPELPTDPIPDQFIDLYTRKRRQDDGSELLTDSAICQAVLTENACNPVLRTTARVTLAVAERENPDRLAMIRNELMMTSSGDTMMKVCA